MSFPSLGKNIQILTSCEQTPRNEKMQNSYPLNDQMGSAANGHFFYSFVNKQTIEEKRSKSVFKDILKPLSQEDKKEIKGHGFKITLVRGYLIILNH
jgi:hypothetical protein